MWTFPEVGLVVDAGGAYLLPRLVGMARAKAMVMLGEPSSASTPSTSGSRTGASPTPTRSHRARGRARRSSRRRADAVARPVEAPVERVRSNATSRTRSSWKDTSRRSPPRRPTSSKGWLRSRRSGTHASTADDRCPRPARRRVRRVHRCRRPAPALPAHRVDGTPGRVDVARRRRRVRRAPGDHRVRELREETGLGGRSSSCCASTPRPGPSRSRTARRSNCTGSASCYRAEVEPGPLRARDRRNQRSAQWFTKDEVAALDLVEVGLLGASYAWK